MIVKKNLAIVLMILIAFSTSSCREQEELEDIAIVVATGLDLEDDEVVLTAEVIIPINRTEQSGSPNSIYIQERGASVMEAIRNVTLNFDRKLFFAHNVVIIYGEDLARAGIGNYLDFFAKDVEPRESAYMLVAKGSKAYELMGVNSSLVDSTGEYLETLFDNTRFTLKSRGLTVNDFFKYYYDRETPLLGIVQKEDIIDIEAGTGNIGTKSMLDIRGGAAFYKDKLMGYYTPEEMIGFNFIVDEVEEGIIVFEAPMELVDHSNIFSTIGHSTTYEIVKNRTKKTIEIIDGKLNLNIEVEVRGLIVEDNRGLATTDLEVAAAVEEVCGEKIKEYMTMAIEKGQELKTDSFGINHLFHMTYPKEYRKIEDRWGHEFSKLDYSMDVNVEIIRTGITNTPQNIIRGED